MPKRTRAPRAGVPRVRGPRARTPQPHSPDNPHGVIDGGYVWCYRCGSVVRVPLLGIVAAVRQLTAACTGCRGRKLYFNPTEAGRRAYRRT